MMRVSAVWLWAGCCGCHRHEWARTRSTQESTVRPSKSKSCSRRQQHSHHALHQASRLVPSPCPQERMAITTKYVCSDEVRTFVRLCAERSGTSAHAVASATHLEAREPGSDQSARGAKKRGRRRVTVSEAVELVLHRIAAVAAVRRPFHLPSQTSSAPRLFRLSREGGGSASSFESWGSSSLKPADGMLRIK